MTCIGLPGNKRSYNVLLITFIKPTRKRRYYNVLLMTSIGLPGNKRSYNVLLITFFKPPGNKRSYNVLPITFVELPKKNVHITFY